MRRLLFLLAALVAVCGAERAAAQYYTWGSDPPMKWSAIRTPDVRMIYPDTVAGIARRVDGNMPPDRSSSRYHSW